MNVAIGERYAGIILNKNGTLSHHLILLPQQPDDRLTWDGAMAWAMPIGGDLPTRQEQALLFSNCKDAFDPDWYWSCEQYAGDAFTASGSRATASTAWYQYFGTGLQGNYIKGYKGHVRAVRRVYA